MAPLTCDVADLFARAMIGLDEDEEWTPENPIGWQAVGRLHSIASLQVLELALAACKNAHPLKRRVGAAVLGQLGHSKTDSGNPVFLAERYHGLADLLANECAGQNDSSVVYEACVALGHLHDARAIPALLERSRHPDAIVRLGVVFGLWGYETPEAIDGLIALTSDCDEEVRDWATSGLATQIATDTPAIRAALHACLNDPCVDAQNEAIEGLALRSDETVLPVLIRELCGGGLGAPLLNAAIAFATPKLCEALTAAKALGLIIDTEQQSIDLTKKWVEAMRACGCPNSGE